MRRIQLMVPDEDYDKIAFCFYDGVRSRAIRYLLLRTCEAILDREDDLATDDIIRGEFRVIQEGRGNF